MADNNNDILEIVTNSFNRTYAEHIQDKRNTRSETQGSDQLDDLWSKMCPLLIASLTTVMTQMETRNKKLETEHNTFKNHYQDNLMKQEIKMDKIDALSRQDHILLIGHTEPNKNYDRNGRESQEELENILQAAGQKVNITINPEDISVAFRLGNNHKDADGTPKFYKGKKVARPILYKFTKRSKRTELLKAKKDLRNSHSIKIGEDTTPLRRALCEYVNKLSQVKVAYPQDGKICVRLHSNDNKVIRLESYLDLPSIGDNDPINWTELKLDELRL